MTALLDHVEDAPCCRDALLDHCHGSRVRHADQAEECTDGGCQAPPEGHADIVSCTVIAPECSCV